MIFRMNGGRFQPAGQHWALALISAILLGPGAVRAETPELADLSLEELVRIPLIQTPKFAVNAEFTPSSVSLLSREEIRLFGWRTLGDALRSLNGYTITSDHTYSYAGVRGIAAPGDYRTRLQLLIDGIPVNENIFGSAGLDSAFPLDLDLVEHIEVIRGPSASVFGGDSAFGVINVVTRSGSSLQGGEVSLARGSGQADAGRLSWGGRSEGGSDVLLSYSGGESAGRRLYFAENAAAGQEGAISGLEAERSAKFFARLRNDAWRATLIHSRRDELVPTGSFGTLFNDRAHREADDYTLAEVANDYQFTRETSLHTRIYAGQYSYRGRFPYGPDPRVLNRDVVEGQWWGWESRMLTTAWAGHRWIGGVEYKANIRQDQRNDDLGYGCFGVGPAPCLNDRRQSEQGSFYVQDEIVVGNATYLTLGLRYDKSSTASDHWSPRLGLVYQNEHGGTFKLLYATAFSDPTVYQKYYVTPVYSVGNPDLHSESMRSVELTWEQRLGARSRLNTSLYNFRLQEMVGISPSSGLYANYPDVTARGLELEFQHRWLNQASLRLGYTLQDVSMPGGHLENVPRHALLANLAVPLLGSQWFAGLEGQLLSRRRTGGGTGWVAGYGVVNLNLSYRPVGQPWDLALGIYNLFDHQYADPVALDTTPAGERDRMLQFGRSFRLKFTARF